MKSDLKVAIARNLLEEKTCLNCDKSLNCTIKLGQKYGTCRRWKEIKELDFKITSRFFNLPNKPLKITWTKETFNIIDNDIKVYLIENNDFAIYKHLEEWKDGGALQVLSDRSCTTCIKADKCEKPELNDVGFCEDYKYFDGSAESMIIKLTTEEIERSIDEEVIKNVKTKS